MKILNTILNNQNSFRIVEHENKYYIQKLGFLIGWHDIKDGKFNDYKSALIYLVQLTHNTIN